MLTTLYTPLQDAVEELHKRQSVPSLQKRIQDEITLPAHLQVLFEKPHLVMFRQVLTPLTEVLLFLKLAKKYNFTPFVIEFHKDKFVSTGNPYKRGLGKLPIHKFTNIQNIEAFEYRTIVDFNKNVGKELGQVTTFTGESLMDVHHDLFLKIADIHPDTISADGSDWFKSYGTSDMYYEHFLKLFIRDGILFETFLSSGEEAKLTFDIVMPAFTKCMNALGYKPLIAHATYENTSDDPEILNHYPKITAEILSQKGYS